MSERRDRPRGPFKEMSEAQRADSLRAAMAQCAPGSPVWVFAYGSLMWSPCFAFSDRRPACLEGYRRGFTIWTALARGTPELPGLALALEAGPGRCHGVAYRLEPARQHEGLEALWQREMVTGIYRPRWLPVGIEESQIVALCFVVDRAHVQYAGPLPIEERAAIIARAEGKFGACRDYLRDTLRALAENEISDPALEALLNRVQRHTEGGDP
jgi:cation transport protein ChaC